MVKRLFHFVHLLHHLKSSLIRITSHSADLTTIRVLTSEEVKQAVKKNKRGKAADRQGRRSEWLRRRRREYNPNDWLDTTAME